MLFHHCLRYRRRVIGQRDRKGLANDGRGLLFSASRLQAGASMHILPRDGRVFHPERVTDTRCICYPLDINRRRTDGGARARARCIKRSIKRARFRTRFRTRPIGRSTSLADDELYPEKRERRPSPRPPALPRRRT